MVEHHLSEGKIDHDILTTLTKQTGVHREAVIQSPAPGSDVAVIELQKIYDEINQYYETESIPYLVYKSDPITFPTSKPGWYLIMVNQNDLATSGAIAVAMSVTILLPPESTKDEVLEIQQQLHETAKEYNISVVGGHTEVTSSVNSVVLAGNMLGLVPPEFYIGNSIQVGYSIILSGWIGAEGTGILYSENKEFWEERLSSEERKQAQELGDNINIAKRTLPTIREFHDEIGMIHDITEGGVLSAVFESVEPMRLGARLIGQEIPIAESTFKICNELDIDPLKLIGSGAVLIYCKTHVSDEIMKFLRNFDFPAKMIGKVTEENQFLLDNQEFAHYPDSLIRGLERLSQLSG